MRFLHARALKNMLDLFAAPFRFTTTRYEILGSVKRSVSMERSKTATAAIKVSLCTQPNDHCILFI